MKASPLLAIVALSLASCAGDGVVPAPPAPPPPGTPTLSSLEAAIFTPRCAIPGCHVGAGAPLGMDLSQGHLYPNVVGVDSQELAGWKRVVAGSSADSYLVLKISGDPRIIGERMPFGGPYLSVDEIDAIRAWIDAGAADD